MQPLQTKAAPPNFTAEISKVNDIVQIMQRWGEWVRSDRKDYKRALNVPTPWIGRAQSFTSSVNCPACRGKGSVVVEIKKQARRVVCKRCAGACSVMMNPALAVQKRKCLHCVDKQGIARGEINGRTCVRCRGAGIVPRITQATLIVPAFIRAEGGRGDTDDISWRVDRLVCGLPKIQHAVVEQEYCWSGRQTDKCSRVNLSQKTQLSETEYEGLLRRALTIIGEALREV